MSKAGLSPALRDAGYIGVALAAWVLTSLAWYALLRWLHLTRPASFLSSMGLELLATGLGLAFEDRYLWRGYFDGRYPRHDILAGGRRTAPPPLTVGIIAGLLIFFFWHP